MVQDGCAPGAEEAANAGVTARAALTAAAAIAASCAVRVPGAFDSAAEVAAALRAPETVQPHGAAPTPPMAQQDDSAGAVVAGGLTSAAGACISMLHTSHLYIPCPKPYPNPTLNPKPLQHDLKYYLSNQKLIPSRLGEDVMRDTVCVCVRQCRRRSRAAHGSRGRCWVSNPGRRRRRAQRAALVDGQRRRNVLTPLHSLRQISRLVFVRLCMPAPCLLQSRVPPLVQRASVLPLV